MRLTPSMSILHKRLLGWKYEEEGALPPDTNLSELAKIPDQFADCSEYARVFEPLLLLECWAQFQRAKEETMFSEPCEAVLQSRMSEDDFQDITYLVSVADAKDMVENDVVPSSAQAPGINSRFAGRQTFLAKVQNRVFGKDSVQVVVRVFFQGARLALFLNKLVLKSMWEFFKLYSLTPMHREYAALRSLPYLNEKLVEEVLAPRPIVHEALGRLEVQECMKTHALNQPQAEAVVSAIKRDHGFTLIQGPPGTGKTKTILGLSGALLSRDKQRESAEDSNAGNERDPKPRKRNNKLLICAPSNAAVDEIVKRLKSGIRDEKGRTFHPSVVRVGLSDSISSTVRDTTLDFLMEKALNAFQVGQDDETGDDGNMASKDGGISAAQNNLLLSVAGRNHREGKVMQSIDPSDASAMRELRDKFRQTNEKKKSIYQRLDTERGRAREASKTIDATKHKIRLQILQKTDILCCTLSGSGHDILTSINCTFDTVIIDEAAQSVELSCLIPLKYGCERCILVGDPNQLPPTVLSQAAAQHMYNQSMFVRIQKSSPESVNLLSIQYRMHPEISVFPSRLFYESRLKDGPEMAKKQTAPWHANPKYPPFMFFNIWMGKEQAGRSHSVFNTAEADAAVQLVQNICRDYPNVEFKQKIGVITPYKQQLRVLTEKFTKSFGAKVTDAIEFNTVDGFQGQEKEIIIFSCVRAGGSGVGFLADERRMNVGLTRARKSLFILGNSNMLVVSPLWKSLIDDATRRDLLK
ncbi:P-loop containing nucleoside triphosphate hydrolase protein, partial [Martensiomyces pterosporus]